MGFQNVARVRGTLLVAWIVLISGLAAGQTVDLTGTWSATEVPYEPWTFEFTQQGAKLTGRIGQNGGLRGPVEISEGSVNGASITFKAMSPDGARAFTFTGTVQGDVIQLNRAMEMITTASQGGLGLFGSLTDPKLTIHRGGTPVPAVTTRVPQATITAAQAAPGGAVASPAGSEHWEAQNVGFAPWTFDLKIEGNTVTGTIGQASSDPPTGVTTTRTGPFAISAGKLSGNRIEFKSESAGTVVTFSGTIDGDEIQFRRSVNATGGFNGIFGGNGATEFVARKGRAAANAAPAPAPVRPAIAASAPAPAANLTGGERWQATGVPNAPWVFEFTIVGTTMIGTVRQNGAPREAVTIAAGKVEGSNLSFKVLSPDAERVITFTGRINGNEISFVRQITPLEGGSRGGNDLYGGSAPLQFVATKMNGPTAAVTGSNIIELRGMRVDVGAVKTAVNLPAMLDSLSRQIEIVELAVPNAEKLAFFKSIPLAWAANAPASGDNAAYGGGRVVLGAQIYSAEKPVLLHELLHGYHEQRLANGFANPDIQKLYDQARASGQFPAGSYMLSNRGEYFAMMASVYLHGSAARDPFTRAAVKDKQPDFYAWMEKEFGPR